MAPVSVKSPPPPKPGFGALVTIEWSRRYSQYASNSPTSRPLPERSPPRIWVEGCSRATTAWMWTTGSSRCLTSSIEASMGDRLVPLQMIAEEVLDTALRVHEGGRVEADGRPAALVRLVSVADVGQVGLPLVDHVEVVDGARIENDRGVRPAAPHVGDHLDARARERPVVGVAHQDQQGPRHELVHQRVAPARIDGDRRREAGRRQRDAPPPRALEARAVHDGDREHAALGPADDADAGGVDQPPRVKEAQRAPPGGAGGGRGQVGRDAAATVTDP